jgi:hypothetical protein
LLAGQPYEKVHVNNTTFVSSTLLVANISIDNDAEINQYDIAVRTAGGKQGIGSEMFAITRAVALPGLTGLAINDAGQVIGQDGSDAALWDPGVGLVIVAAGGFAWDIDRTGTTIGGRSAAGNAVIWTSASGPQGPWTETTLPALGAGGSVRSIASDASGQAVLMTGNAFLPNAQPKHPIVWTRSAAGWSERVFSFPAGGPASGWGQSINVRGMVVGMDGTTCCFALYWDSLGTPARLAPLKSGAAAAAWSIDDSGLIAVGQSANTAVMWTRPSATASWSIATALENTGSLCTKGTSAAFAVNASGTIAVGESCGMGVAWVISGGTVTSRILLGNLGPPNQSSARGINDLAQPNATGTANNSGVYWRNFYP